MKRKIFSVLFALVLLASFSLVTAVPVSAAGTPTIDAVIDTGEWDGAVSIPVDSNMGTVRLLASTDYLYVLFDLVDPNDARTQYQNEVGNDQISLNINPTQGGSWGFPYDLIFETSALSAEDGGHHVLPWNPKDNSGTIDGWATRWFPNDAQEPLPVDLESATIYSGGKRITEWKLPLATIAPSLGDTLKAGGAVDVGDGGSYVYPVGLVWSTVSTFAEYSYRVNNEDTGLYYQTIQDAIDTASGTTLVCAPGTYNENILINKPLTVQSADGAEETTIDGIGFRYMVRIYSSDVTFEGFTVTNPTYEGGSDATGILVGAYLGEPVDNVHILNNIVTQVRSETGAQSMYGATGINIGRAPLSNVVISGNTIENIKNPDGAKVDHTCGINVWDGAEGVEISNNTISDIKYNGILLQRASNVQIEDNPIITGCETGIRVEPFDEGAVSDVTVNLNNFADNNIQVFDGAFEVLDIEDVLVDNIFDRAVVINREGGSLLHTIWSSIQDGIDAAQTDDTVDVAKGTYDEVVAVNESINLLGANDGVCAGVDPGTRGPETIIDGRIDIQASNVVIDGIKLINGFDALGEHAGIYMVDQSHITITCSIFVGPVSPAKPANAMILGSYGGTATTHSEDINVTCCESYNWNMGAYGNPGGGFSTDYLFQYNNFHDNSYCGLGLDVSGVSVLNNNFTDNGMGIEAFRENIVVHFNNFCGNDIGLWAALGVEVNATNNWWCHPSGPTASPGSGDPVSGDVLYDPWLLEPLVPGAPLPTLFDKTLALNIGWTLVSTDNWIDPAETVGVNVVLAYNYTPSLSYFEVDPAALVPVNALYLKTEVGGALGITYSGGVPVASSKPLEAGWNLVSSATIDNAKDVLSPLRYIDVGDEQGFGLATLVSQGPPLNQHTESFYIATLGSGDWNNVLAGTILNPFDGYWVYMNAGKVFGVVPE